MLNRINIFSKKVSNESNIFNGIFPVNFITYIGNFTFEISAGILPYPITFLVTDIVSEIYGKKKANQLVISGFIASIFIMLVTMMAQTVPATTWSPVNDETFTKVFGLFGPAVFASMTAYLIAQFVDIRIFHILKEFTKGKHLWLRNNGSTIFSQLVDTSAVLLLLCSFDVIEWSRFYSLLINGFLFKVFFAAFDTPIVYGLTYVIRKRLGLAFGEEISSG